MPVIGLFSISYFTVRTSYWFSNGNCLLNQKKIANILHVKVKKLLY